MTNTTINTSFQKYPAYKDSGVEWLGEIPEGWDAIRMKFLFRDVSEKNKPEAELLSVTQDQGVVPRTWVENRMVMPSGNLESFKFIRKGDFAISLRSFEGGLEYCHHDGIISPAYTVLKKKSGLIDGYYKYLFKSKSFISEIQTSVVGIREGKNISYFELSYSLLPIPSPAEQTAIANFLDDKTTKIDRAIAQKEQLINLLKERKQIIIQDLVTGKKVWNEKEQAWMKPEKVKDSGVEWIGKIPEGWEVKRLKNLIQNLESGVSVNASESESANENEIGVLKTSAVYRYEFDKNENKKVFKSDLNRVSCPVRKGRIIISRMNAPELVGASGFVKENYPNLFLPDRLWQTVFNNSIEFNSYWLSIVLTTISFRNIVSSLANGSSPSMKNISKPDFLNIFIPFPKFQEQSTIVTHIETQSGRIDKAIKLQEQQIEKLKELKSTLIDGAVTGKIKVN